MVIRHVSDVQLCYWDSCPQNHTSITNCGSGRPSSIALSILNIVKHGSHVCLAGGAPVLLLPLRGPHHHLLHPLQHAQVLRAPGEFYIVWVTNNFIIALILWAPGDGRPRPCSPASAAPRAGGPELLGHGGHPPQADGAPRLHPPAEDCPGEWNPIHSGIMYEVALLLCNNSPLWILR